MFEKVQVGARLRCFLAFWIMKQKILERSLGIVCGRGVLCAFLRSGKPDVADLILGVGRERIVRKFFHDILISGNRQLIRALLFPGASDVKVCARGVLAVGRGSHNLGEDLDRALHGRFDGDAEDFYFVSSHVHLADAE